MILRLSPFLRTSILSIALTLGLVTDLAKAQSDTLMDTYSQFLHYQDLGEIGEAVRFARQTLELARSEFPEDSEILADRIADLAAVELVSAEFKRAVPLYKEALNIYEALTPSSPDKLGASWRALAQAHDGLSANAPAKTAYRKALEQYEIALGSNHPAVGQLLIEYTNFLVQRGRNINEAIEQLGRALLIFEEAFGQNAIELTPVLRNLAVFYNRKVRSDDAVAVLERGLEILETAATGQPELKKEFHSLLYLAHLANDDYQQAGIHYSEAYGTSGTIIPVPIKRVAPQYPFQAAQREISGWVRLSLTISETGDVKAVEVVESDPEGVFDRAAARAAAKWKYAPALNDDGEAIQQEAVQTMIHFQMH